METTVSTWMLRSDLWLRAPVALQRPYVSAMAVKEHTRQQSSTVSQFVVKRADDGPFGHSVQAESAKANAVHSTVEQPIRINPAS